MRNVAKIYLYDQLDPQITSQFFYLLHEKCWQNIPIPPIGSTNPFLQIRDKFENSRIVIKSR